MRVFSRRGGRHERRPINERPMPAGPATCYRSASYQPLRPWQVRERRFRLSPFGRRGLDPDEVAQFLDRVADDLAAVYDALARSRQEADRVRDALRQWQSEQFRARHAEQRRAERGSLR